MTHRYSISFTSDLEPEQSIKVIACGRADATRLARLSLQLEIGAERADCFHLYRIELRAAASIDMRGAA